MIFQNIDFHNVEEIKQENNGYRLYRFPLEVAKKMDEGADRVSWCQYISVDRKS